MVLKYFLAQPPVQCHQPQRELRWKWPKHRENWCFRHIWTSGMSSPLFFSSQLRYEKHEKKATVAFDAGGNVDLQTVNVTVCSSNIFNPFLFISVTIYREWDRSCLSSSHFLPRKLWQDLALAMQPLTHTNRQRFSSSALGEQQFGLLSPSGLTWSTSSSVQTLHRLLGSPGALRWWGRAPFVLVGAICPTGCCLWQFLAPAAASPAQLLLPTQQHAVISQILFPYTTFSSSFMHIHMLTHTCVYL